MESMHETGYLDMRYENEWFTMGTPLSHLQPPSLCLAVYVIFVGVGLFGHSELLVWRTKLLGG